MIDKNFLVEATKEAAYQELIKRGWAPRIAKTWCNQNVKLLTEKLDKHLRAANVFI